MVYVETSSIAHALKGPQIKVTNAIQHKNGFSKRTCHGVALKLELHLGFSLRYFSLFHGDRPKTLCLENHRGSKRCNLHTMDCSNHCILEIIVIVENHLVYLTLDLWTIQNFYMILSNLNHEGKIVPISELGFVPTLEYACSCDLINP